MCGHCLVCCSWRKGTTIWRHVFFVAPVRQPHGTQMRHRKSECSESLRSFDGVSARHGVAAPARERPCAEKGPFGCCGNNRQDLVRTWRKKTKHKVHPPPPRTDIWEDLVGKKSLLVVYDQKRSRQTFRQLWRESRLLGKVRPLLAVIFLTSLKKVASGKKGTSLMAKNGHTFRALAINGGYWRPWPF